MVGSGRSLEGAETVRLGEMEEGARGGVRGEKGQVSGPWMEPEEPPGGFSRGQHGHLRQGAGLGGRAGPGEGSGLQQGQ